MTNALIVGCAEGVMDEVAAAKKLVIEATGKDFDKVYLVKLAGVEWPGTFDVWVTLHPEWMDDYEAQRKAKGYPGGYEIVAPLTSEVGMHGQKGNIHRRLTYRWPKMTGSASSGIFGAKVALEDGCDRIVLAGIGMLPTKHFTRGKEWLQRDSFMPGFEFAKPYLLGKVKSMGGYTKQVLGEPTLDWLKGDLSTDQLGANPVVTAGEVRD